MLTAIKVEDIVSTLQALSMIKVRAHTLSSTHRARYVVPLPFIGVVCGA